MPESRLRHLRGMDEVWTPSEWGRQILIDSGLEETKLRVVPEGVDPTVFRPISRAGLPDRPFRFLSVGTWEPRKGHEMMLRAWAKAFAPEDSVELVLHTSHHQDRSWSLEEALNRLDLGPHAPVVRSRPTTLPRLLLLSSRAAA